MTRKSLYKQIDDLVDVICDINNLSNETEVRGGQVEAANGLLWMALRKLTPEIIATASLPVAPATPKAKTRKAG